jgi:hypothetical protein
MKRISAHWNKVVVLGLVALGLTVGFGAGVASAGPHFDGSEELTTSATGDLTVTWREVGLGNENVTYVLTATADLTCQCVGKSGNCPNAANKATFTSTLSQPITLEPDNGHIDGSLTLPAPTCPTGSGAQPTCGKGQHFVTSGVNYTGISFTDTTNGGIQAALPTSEGPVPLFTCP